MAGTALVDLRRLGDWQTRLIAVVNERRRQSYAYGINDCACFARAAVKAVTGVDVLPGIEAPKGWLASAKFMIERGWPDVEAMATELLGEPIAAAQSRRGDIVSYEEGGELHLAVRVGDEALTPATGGLAVISHGRWHKAWKVG